MSTLSVPITAKIEEVLEDMISNGVADNKASLVRRAIEKFAEDTVVERILRAERDINEGKFLQGDLDKLSAKLD